MPRGSPLDWARLDSLLTWQALIRVELDESQSIRGDEHIQTISLLLFLGETCRYLRKLEEAATCHRAALETLTHVLDGTTAGADQWYRELLALREDSTSHLGNCLVSMGELDEAEEHLRTSMELTRRQAAAPSEKGNPQQRALEGLARCLGKRVGDAAKLCEAERLARHSWALRSRQWGNEHDSTHAAKIFVDSLREKRCRERLRTAVARHATVALTDGTALAVE